MCRSPIAEMCVGTLSHTELYKYLGKMFHKKGILKEQMKSKTEGAYQIILAMLFIYLLNYIYTGLHIQSKLFLIWFCHSAVK